MKILVNLFYAIWLSAKSTVDSAEKKWYQFKRLTLLKILVDLFYENNGLKSNYEQFYGGANFKYTIFS